MAPTTSGALRWVVPVVLAGAFVLLGVAVTRFGEPPALATFDRVLLDHGTLTAWWLTWSCYAGALVPICIGLGLVAWKFPVWRLRIAISIGVLLLAWLGADACQHLFARPRRLDWVVKHETAFSYPSTHAAIAAGFYGMWAELVRRSGWSRPLRIAFWFGLIGLAVGIGWSRLALGAHYASDVVGGALLGASLAAAGLGLAAARR